MRPELVKEFIVEFTKETNRHRHEIELEQEAKHKELANVTRRLNGLIDAIADGLRTPGLKAKLDETERCKAALEKSLSTAGFRKGLLWARPERIATDIRRAIERRSEVVYTPWYWRYVMLLIRAVPESIFKRLKL